MLLKVLRLPAIILNLSMVNMIEQVHRAVVAVLGRLPVSWRMTVLETLVMLGQTEAVVREP